jgi:hypothetical protein
LISFRYHLVSIVAVFLALALGVVMGTTVVKQGVIDQLRSRTDDAVATTHRLQSEVNQLQGQLKTDQGFAQQAQSLLVSERLAGQEVVMVTVDGVDASEIDGVRRTLEQSGAKVVSVLAVTPRMALSNETEQTAMAAVLGVSAASPETLSAQAAQTLGLRLAAGPPGTGVDPLQQFMDHGFVALRGGTGSPQTIATQGQAFVFMAGGAAAPPVDPKGFLVPLLTQIVDANRPVVTAEPSTTTYEFVSLIRDDGALNNRLVTVDDADTVPGRVAVVLGMRNLIQNPGRGGNYGVKAGASGLIPAT